MGRNGSSFRRLRQRCLNVDGHPIHLVVFMADGGLQKRGQTGIERAGLLEVQSAIVNLIQLAEYVPRQRIAVLARQTDPPVNRSTMRTRLAVSYPARCSSGVKVR